MNQYSSQAQEALAIASACDGYIKQGHAADEIAVLVRTQRQMAELEFGMVRAYACAANVSTCALQMKCGLFYRLVGGKSLFKHAALKDCLAYLSLCVHPTTDVLALDRIINTPARKLGPKSKGQLRVIAAANDQTLNELLLGDLEGLKGPPPASPDDMPLPPGLHDVKGLGSGVLGGVRSLRYTICRMRAACAWHAAGAAAA